MVVSPIDLPNVLGFIELPQLEHFLAAVNTIRSCVTPGCKGNLHPVGVKCRGLGGGISVSCCCDGCGMKGAMFDTHSRQVGNTNTVSMCVQVAFIVAGSTHASYYKTLKHALGIEAVSEPVFTDTIYAMYPVVKSMLDAVCEAAKQEMREKGEDVLGSWKKAVTVADGTWQTRGWHSKNCTFTVRNYLTGALLYYHHLCQKGRDNVIQELYKGTSKSAEGYAAHVTFERAKKEGMDIAVHWQDADSSSAKAFSEVFPDAEVMICGGHAGRAHKKILELRQKCKKASKPLLDRYGQTYPALGELTCKCSNGNHSDTCGCLTAAFISKAHTNFTSILMEAQSQEEFAKRLEALPKHACNIHEWEGGRCDFHPLRVCTCKKCSDLEQIKCKGEPYKTRLRLDCAFHALLYEIECTERAKQASKLVHPVLKRGHSNAVEASHNVLIRFRSKDISLERLHYQVSTNLGLLQANLTYMQAKLGTSYHWIPELYRCMELPVFEGVVEALEKHSIDRKRRLDLAKTTPAKKRRVWLKKKRVLEGKERIKWSKMHGHHTYNAVKDSVADGLGEGDSSDMTGQSKAKGKLGTGRCAACGSSTHRRSSHKDCPHNKSKAKREGQLQSARTYGYTSESFEDMSDDNSSHSGCWDGALSDSCSSEESVVEVCTCGAERRAHKRGCPLSSRSSRTLFPPPSSSSSSAASSLPKPAPLRERKLQMKVGDYVGVHSKSMGKYHLPCRIVAKFGSRYQLYCSKAVLNRLFSGRELTTLSSNCSIPLDKWRWAPRVSLRSVAGDPTVVEPCNCNLPVCSESSVVISSASEEEDLGCEVWVRNILYSLSISDRRTVTSPTGWLTDTVITAAQALLLQHFPSMSGLQPPTLQQVRAFQVHSGEFVQIINIRKKHWCVVSSVGCEKGAVNVYDSLYSSVSEGTVSLIASMVHSSASNLVVRMMNVEKQSNGSDCGVLSVAYAFDICSGFDPCKARYNHKKIRQHLAVCLEKCHFSRFPLSGNRNCVPVKSSETTELHCSCHMPEELGDQMAQCDSCQIWYHRHCMDIPSEVFEKSDIPWKCMLCCPGTNTAK